MSSGIGYLDAIILGVVEGVTEFLPISSTGHLTIAEGLLDLPTDSDQVTAFTAVVQMGAILAAVLFFRHDIIRIIRAFLRGAVSVNDGGVIEQQGEGPLRNLWVVAAALILWCPVMIYAERQASQARHEQDLTYRDALYIGLLQCFALIPGVSRSGATISAGLLRGIDRVTATRLSFLLGIPALFAAELLELKKAVSTHGSLGPTLVGWPATIVATVVSFVVAYLTIAWLLRFVSHHSIARFVPYRVALGLVVILLLVTNVVSATG